MKSCYSSLTVVAFFVTAILFSNPLFCAEIKFDSLDAAALQQAIKGATDGDVIILRQPGTINLDKPIQPDGAAYININKDITIIGQDGPLAHTLDGVNLTHHFKIDSGAVVTLKKLTLQNGHSNQNGGSISSSGNLVLNNIKFVNNHSDEDGGAIYQAAGNLDITSCYFDNNSTNGNGGAVAASNSASVTVDACGFILNGVNIATDGSQIVVTNSGGGIWSAGSTAVKNSLFYNNKSSSSGGAIYLSGQSAGSAENPQLLNLTLIGNTSPLGQHVYSTPGEIHIGNSIIEGEGELPGTVNVKTAEYNLSGEFDETLIGDYGGLSPSFPLLPGSAAIDMGNSDFLDKKDPGTDQRGLTRESDGDGNENVIAVDIGAFEVQMYKVSALQIRGSATGGVDDGGYGNPYDPSDDADSLAAARNFEALTNSNKADIGDAVGANNAAGAGAISFTSQIVPGTITLKGRELEVRKDLAIYGPGANVLAVDGSGQSRIIKLSDGAKLYVNGLGVQDGVADSGGGILVEDGELTLVESSIHNNRALSAGGGMAINSGKAAIARSSFIGNSAATDGGAIRAGSTTSLDIINSTLSYNQAGAKGGAIWTAGTLALKSSTLVDNFSSDNVPGVLLSGHLNTGSEPSPDVILLNSIFLHGAASIENNNADLSAGFLLSDALEPALSAESYRRVSPITELTVGSLEYNGGTTLSHPPTPGGAAINTGSNEDAPPNDQRGLSRPKGKTIDIGSIEFQNELPTITFNSIPGKIVPGTGGSTVVIPAEVEYSVNDDSFDDGNPNPELEDKVTVYWYLGTGTEGNEKGTLLYTTEVQPDSYGTVMPPLEFPFSYGLHTLIVDVWDKYSSADNPDTYTTSVVSVLINDGIPPYFSASVPQVNVGILSDYSSCEAPVTLSVEAFDNESELNRIEIVRSDGKTGNLYGLGTHTVTFVAYDNAGNSSPKEFSFSVTPDADKSSPYISGADTNQSYSPGADQCAYGVPIQVAATDCTTVGISIDIINLESGEFAVPSLTAQGSIDTTVELGWGTYTVNVTATDEAGNDSFSSYDVTVYDTIKPSVEIVWISDVNNQDFSPIETIADTEYIFDTRPGYCYIELAFTPESLPDCSLDSYSLFLVKGDVDTPINSSHRFTPGQTYTVKCIARDKSDLVSDPFKFKVTVNDTYENCAQNISWPNALELAFDPDTGWASIPQYIALTDQSRWYKLTVTPGSRITAILSGLPANYDIVVYKDIGAEYERLVNLLGGDSNDQKLALLGAEFAPDSFSPDSFSPDSFSPDSFSPDSFSPDSFSPDAFSPDSFSPDSFSPDSFSPDSFSPDSFSPDSFSPDSFSPDSFSPDSFSPDAFSPDTFSPDTFSPDSFSAEFFTPDAFSPDAFSSAQTSSMIAFSAYPGLSNEGIRVNTYTYSGDIYIRVKGSNGAYNTGDPFNLSVFVQSDICSNIEDPSESWGSHPAATTAKEYKTIILWDSFRMGIYGTDADEIDALGNKLQAFADLPEIQGIVVDLAQDSRVSFANAQADNNLPCPYAKNLVADEIKAVIDIWDADHPLEYAVLIGNDDVIPFFRIADDSNLAIESNYYPPVRDNTPSQSSLRNGLVLTQDPYGSKCEVNLATGPYSYPNLAVGRLVESAGDVISQLQNYMDNPGGMLPVPDTALVTGYDFLVDVATEIEAELSTAINQPVDSLIAQDAATTWTSKDLADALLKKHHDLVFLAGHFSTGSTLASDFQTRLTAKQALDSQANMLNTLVFSAGCHSGYNTVDKDAVTGITQQPDWAQAFAKLGGILIAGTGYQYGDTEFIEYSERLYLEFARQLRTGSGEVAIGHALNRAKKKYLAETPIMRGIHEKSLVQATLFGLPMLKLNVPGERITIGSNTNPSIVTADVNPTTPGSAFGLKTAEITVTPALVKDSRIMINSDDDSEIVVEWYKSTNLSSANPIGFISNPSEPVRPLETIPLTVSDSIVRGVGFIGGTYADSSGFIPMTGAPTTEIRAVYGNFYSDVMFPIKPYSINSLGAICGGTEGERLNVYPTQFISNENGGLGGTLRKYTDMKFRLFYNNDTGLYSQTELQLLTPSLLASPPSIANVTSTITTSNSVEIKVNVLGLPSAGIQEVWVTYTGLEGSEFYGEWQSVHLVQDANNSTLWTKSLQTANPDLLRFIVQAASGTGLVAMSTNHGRYFVAGQNDSIEGLQTKLELLEPLEDPSSFKYGDNISVKAKLSVFVLSEESGTWEWQPVAGKLVGVRVENSSSMRSTDAQGIISLDLPLTVRPGLTQLQAFFNGTYDGDVYLSPCSTAREIDIDKQDTKLTWMIPGQPDVIYPEFIIAELTDYNEKPISGRTVFFLIKYVDPELGEYGASVVTDIFGKASLENSLLPTGVASVTAFFNGEIYLPHEELPVQLEDEVYNSATAITKVLNIEERSLAFYPEQVDVYYKAPATKGNKPAVPVYENASIAGNVEITIPLTTKDGLLEGLADPGKIKCWVEAYLAGQPIASEWVELDTRADNGTNWTTASRPGEEVSFVNLHWTDVGDGSPVIAGTLNIRLAAIDGTAQPKSNDPLNLFEIRLKLGEDDAVQVRSVTQVGEGLYAVPWSSEDPGHKQYRP